MPEEEALGVCDHALGERGGVSYGNVRRVVQPSEEEVRHRPHERATIAYSVDFGLRAGADLGVLSPPRRTPLEPIVDHRVPPAPRLANQSVSVGDESQMSLRSSVTGFGSGTVTISVPRFPNPLIDAPSIQRFSPAMRNRS